MGATDNSFIKAYKQQPGTEKVSVEKMPGVYADEAGFTVSTASVATALATREKAVSHLYAAADRIRTQSAPINTSAAAVAPPANIPGVRIDGADPVMPPAPHLAVATLAEANPHVPIEAPVETKAPLTEEENVPTEDAAEAWQAQWEVDSVAWPEIVQQLTDEWTGELSALIRPLLTSAWQGQNVIAVTSFTRGEGATTMAMCLAKMAASFRVPVALIDGDLVEPGIGTGLGLAFGQGWNTLPPELPLSEAAISSAADRMVVIPGSSHLGLGDQATTAYHALDELSNNFDLVILDAGPIFTAAHRWFDGPAAENIHGTLIVQDVRSTSGNQIEDVCSRLGEVGMDHVAIVENFREAA